MIKDIDKYRVVTKSACTHFVFNLLNHLTCLKRRFPFEGDYEVLSSMCNKFDPILYMINDWIDNFFRSAYQIVNNSECK